MRGVLVDGRVGRPRRTIQDPRARFVGVEGQRDVLEIRAALQDTHKLLPPFAAVLPQVCAEDLVSERTVFDVDVEVERA